MVVPSSAGCAAGGWSEPLMVLAGELPYEMVSVKLAVKTYDATVEDAVDPSKGATPPDADVSFTVESEDFAMV